MEVDVVVDLKLVGFKLVRELVNFSWWLILVIFIYLLSSCNRDLVVYRVKSIYCLVFKEKFCFRFQKLSGLSWRCFLENCLNLVNL